MDLETAKSAAAQALRDGDREKALSAAGRAVQLATDDADALLLLAAAQIEMAQPEFALPPLLRALSLDPGNPRLHFALALLEEGRGRPAAALEALRKAARGAVAAAIERS